MAQRGRKSAVALATVAVIPGQRPAPPAELTEEQAEEWRAIVATKPPEWFNRELAGAFGGAVPAYRDFQADR